MTSLKINNGEDSQTPSQELTSNIAQEHVVTDSTGRRITLKKPGLLAQYRLVQILGGETASNQVYMNMVLPITFVVAIDGAPVPTPMRFAEIEALIQRLDEHGLQACVDGLQQHWGAASKNADDTLAAVKT